MNVGQLKDILRLACDSDPVGIEIEDTGTRQVVSYRFDDGVHYLRLAAPQQRCRFIDNCLIKDRPVDELPKCPKCGTLHNDYSYENTCDKCGTVFIYTTHNGTFKTFPLIRDLSEGIALTDLSGIEEALGIKLYQPQKVYLVSGSCRLFVPRGGGRTLAHCIKLALSTGDPLDYERPDLFSDRPQVGYSKDYYLQMFRDVRSRLKSAGFKVRSVVLTNKEGRKLDE